jgi:hypothetical protein
MPVYNNKLAPDRPGQGFAGHTARRLRLEHQGLAHVFKDWDIRARNVVQLHWGGTTMRSSKVYLAATVVDHPQLDKFAGSGG